MGRVNRIKHAIEIRTFDAGDTPSVVTLWRACFDVDSVWGNPEAVIRRKLLVQTDLFVVADDGDRIVGTSMGGYDGCRGCIHHVVVASDHRGQGIGRLLIDETENRIRALGAPEVSVHVDAKHPEAALFYMSLGYAIETRVHLNKTFEAEQRRRLRTGS